MKPIYRITANGEDITRFLQERAASIEVQDSAGTKSDSCSITCSRRGMVLPSTGAELNVKLGYKSSRLWDMGIFAVDEFEVGHTSVSIRAKAATFSATKQLKSTIKSQVTRSWDNVTLGAIVGAIASTHGYDPVVAANLADTLITHIDQTDESDLHFLTRLAKDHGAIAKTVAGRLLFVERGKSKAASGKQLPITTIALDELSPDWRITIKDRGKFQSVRAHYHDPQKAQKRTVRAGSGDPTRTLSRTFPDATAAQNAATAELSALQRGTQELTCSMTGRPLFAEVPIKIDFGDPLLAADWIVTQATHTLNSSGYRLNITAEAKK